jgi:hypothetical protein
MDVEIYHASNTLLIDGMKWQDEWGKARRKETTRKTKT